MKIIRLIVVVTSLVLITSCGRLDQVQTSTSGAATIVAGSLTPIPTDRADDPGAALHRDGDDRLTPLSPSETSVTVMVIQTLPTQGRGPKTGYRRDLFRRGLGRRRIGSALGRQRLPDPRRHPGP